jgi:hypothetical protein
VILVVEGDDGGPPYLSRWDDGHQSLFFPGSHSTVKHYPVPGAIG